MNQTDEQQGRDKPCVECTHCVYTPYNYAFKPRCNRFEPERTFDYVSGRTLIMFPHVLCSSERVSRDDRKEHCGTAGKFFVKREPVVEYGPKDQVGSQTLAARILRLLGTFKTRQDKTAINCK